MIGCKSRTKRDVWVNPRMRAKRKAWINAFRKRLALMELATACINNDPASAEKISAVIARDRKLEPALHNPGICPQQHASPCSKKYRQAFGA